MNLSCVFVTVPYTQSAREKILPTPPRPGARASGLARGPSRKPVGTIDCGVCSVQGALSVMWATGVPLLCSEIIQVCVLVL